MIYTVTFNPSLDYVVSVDDFTSGAVNRTKSELIYPGGKGINVSIVLKNLGVESTALGFLAGFTGERVCTLLEEAEIRTDFIWIEEGMSRINVKLRSTEETEINGQGPAIDATALEMLYGKLEQLQEDDILVLAGSIPASMPSDTYEAILKRLQGKKIKIVVDATKDLLVKVLPYHPFLIKPNHHELGELFGEQISSREEVIPYAKKLQELGATNVLVSMAGEGAVLLTESGEVYEDVAPQGVVKNSVGAGDSMVAGFLTGYLEKGDFAYAFRMGLMTGSASAFSEGLAKKEEVLALMSI